MLYTFWSFIITKGGWFSGLKLLQSEKACLESISSLKKKKKNASASPDLGIMSNLAPSQMVPLRSHCNLTPAKWLGYSQPCCLPEFISRQICLVASPSWSASVLLSRGTDPEAVIHLGSIFPLDCQPDSDPGEWWFKLKQTWARSKPLVLICRKTSL